MSAVHGRRTRRVVGSMLWSAWADALGFISELTDEAGLRRRLGGKPLDAPVVWTRRVGGRFGVDVRLPAGCYSDDTQLRLATARAISSRGFDVEAFARIELPVWPAYALGGGRASKAAAANLAKSGVPWFGNFFDGWTNAGGNGVAMRVQPHIWAAPQPADLGPHLIDVLLNAVTTHGHPRALVGAVLHALALGSTLDSGEVPSPDQWPALLDLTEQAIKLVDDHPELSSLWRTSWEKTTQRHLTDAWRETVDECRQVLPDAQLAVEALAKAEEVADAVSRDSAYKTLIGALGLADEKTRGSGTATVIAALVLAAAYPNDPSAGALLSARALGTDTDTIATMAAAIAGAVSDLPLPAPLMDVEYLTAEATRLADIAAGQPTEPFSYPDPVLWFPPQTQIDTVGTVDGTLALAGMGWLEPMPNSEPHEARGAVWQWMRSDFGATFLLKRRAEARPLPVGARPFRRQRRPDDHDNAQQAPLPLDDIGNATTERVTTRGHAGTVDLSGTGTYRPEVSERHREVNVDQMLSWVARRGYSDRDIGQAMRILVARGTLEQAIAFTTALWASAKNRAHPNHES